MTHVHYLVERMKEASSWAGLVGALLAALHIAASPDLINAALGLVAATGGLLAVAIPETAAPPSVAISGSLPGSGGSPVAPSTASGGGSGTGVVRCLVPALVAAALALGVSACTSAPVAAPSAGTKPAAADPLATIAGFVTSDLENARSIAKANNDAVAAQCFTYLIPEVAAAQRQLGTLAPDKISGGFSAFEAGRVAANNIKGFAAGVPQGLNLACAPLVLDSGNTLAALAARIGITLALPAAGLLPAP